MVVKDEANVRKSPHFIHISELLSELKTTLELLSRTSKLWIQYLRYVDVAKIFLYAERTSNWKLHLYAVSQMLNLFAATGHNNYAKSARLYLQEMQQLETTHPRLYERETYGTPNLQLLGVYLDRFSHRANADAFS